MLMQPELRMPAVAGQFYEAEGPALTEQLEECYLDRRGPGQLPQVNPAGPRRMLGLVSPHAGYMYSGPIAAYGYTALAADGAPDAFVILGPNHGRGSWVSAIQTSGAWLTPLGEAQIDEALAAALAPELPDLEVGAQAFRGEHSLEVQLPFLQHLYGEGVKFVPIMMLDQEREAAEAIGQALGRVLAGRNVVMIASTDMTHQEPRPVAAAQDQLLIERMTSLDPVGLLSERARRDITMCGYGPTAALLIAAQALGATRTETFRYGDSGEAHPMGAVVGYLSLGVYR
jgi:AmmeMemoRadiSam system protein B